jgi:hypothetical protein
MKGLTLEKGKYVVSLLMMNDFLSTPQYIKIFETN